MTGGGDVIVDYQCLITSSAGPVFTEKDGQACVAPSAMTTITSKSYNT